MGWLENITSGAFSLNYVYDEWANRCLGKRSNGILTKWNYDTEGRGTELIHEDEKGILEAFRCGYDPTGNWTYLKRESREEECSFYRTYEYDPLDRLITIKEKENLSASFTYDGYGNRIKEYRYKNGEETQIRELTYNVLKQLTGDGENRYTYDAKGNLTEVKSIDGTVHRLAYDNNGSLTELYETGHLLQQNLYNGAGIRVESIIKDTRTSYVPDYADPYHRTIAEYTEDGSIQNYLWHENTLIGMLNETIHVLTDLFHSPVRIIAEDGNTRNLYQYDEYGILKSHKESIPLLFGFGGYRKETIPQLYFTGSREYNVESGRFLSKDPYRYKDYKNPLSLNLYVYGKNNPLRYLDYDGHECIEEKSYLERSLEMIILGSYTDEVTLLGFLGSLALSLIGLDLPADLRDLTACFTVNFNPSDPMWWLELAGCLVSFLPLVGGLKFIDEGAELLKYSDEAAEATGDTGKYLDELTEAGADAQSKLDELEQFYEEIYEQQRMPFDEYEDYLDELRRLQDEEGMLIEGGLDTLSKPSSKVLRQNLIEAGVEVPDYPNAAHHIVAGNAPKAAEARAILQKYGVDINDAANGTFLPTVKDVAEGAYHPSLHTDSYYRKVTELLSSAKSQDDVLDILDDIAEQLQNGTFK